MVRWTRQPRQKIRQGGVDVPYKDIRVMNPSRGLNLLVADIMANDKEASAGTKNIEYAEGGIARKRPGYSQFGDALTNVAHGLGWYSSEAATYPMVSDGGILKKQDPSSGAWSTLSASITVDVNAHINFTTLFQKTYAWDGVNGGVVWDGSSVTRPGTMPRAKFSVIYKGYHVSSGVNGQPFRLYFAPPGEPSRFTNSVVPSDPNDVALNDAANVPGATVFSGDASSRAIDINKNDGQKVTGLGFFQDVLIVFKERSIYQLYFNDSNGFVVERISSSYGAVCHGAIASVENDCYFLTDKGVYVLGNEPNYFSSIRTNELSSRVKPLLKQIDPANFDKCQAVYFDDRYFLSVPMRQSNVNALIVYDRRFYAWSYWDNIYANSLLVFHHVDDDNQSHLLFTDDQSARMNEFTWGVYNDNGDPIRQVFRTRAFEGKKVEIEKYWYQLKPVFRSNTGEVQIGYITENGTEGKPVRFSVADSGGLGVDEIGAALFGLSEPDTFTDSDLGLEGSSDTEDVNSSDTDSSHHVYTIGVNIDSRALKVEFVNEVLNESFALLGWVILYQEKDEARTDGNFTIR